MRPISRASKNVLFAMSIIIAIFFDLITASGQSDSRKYHGFDAGLGIRSARITSNLPQIDNMVLTAEGGTAGFIIGNDIVRSGLSGGFFYSSASVPRTIDLFEGTLSANVYPMNIFSPGRRIVPYLKTAFVYNKLKFAGNYLLEDLGANTYDASDVYRGFINQGIATLGAGFEYNLLDDVDFCFLYSEINYGISVLQQATNNRLDETSSAGRVAISIGVRFGTKR